MSYKRVQYVQTNQTYFQSNVKTGANSKALFDMELVSVFSNDGIMGTGLNWNESATFDFLAVKSRGQWTCYVAGTPFDYAGAYVEGNRCTVELTTSSFKVYNTVTSSYDANVSFSQKTPSTSSSGVKLGSGFVNNTMGIYRFYEITLYSGDTVVGHFLPYKDETTGYGVLYDSVTDTYLNAATPSAATVAPFETDTDLISADYSGTSTSVTITADSGLTWTASTSDSWITLTNTTGSGDGSFSVSVSQNKNYSARNGSITVTSSEADEITIDVEQTKYPSLISQKPLYRSGDEIVKMYRSGELIYLRVNPPTNE